MSFRCTMCNRPMPAKAKPRKIVTQRREKRYRNEHKGKVVESTGWEIVKEESACARCEREHGGAQSQAA